MQSQNLIQQAAVPGREAANAVLREARKLHHAACSGALSKSLPVLRRVLSSNTLQSMSLPALFRARDTVQRKHILRMLAIEAGFASWESYRRALDTMTTGQLAHFDIVQRDVGYPNFWFSSFAEAQAYAAEHGGHGFQVGRQGVVVPPATSA